VVLCASIGPFVSIVAIGGFTFFESWSNILVSFLKLQSLFLTKYYNITLQWAVYKATLVSLTRNLSL
jgi:hypothetical protein